MTKNKTNDRKIRQGKYIDTVSFWHFCNCLAITLLAVLNIQIVNAAEFSPAELRVMTEVRSVCDAVLVQGATPDPEPIIFRQQNVGERYRLQFEDRYSVRLDHVHPSGQPERFVAEVSAPNRALRLAPFIFLGMDQSCNLQQGRYLQYRGDMAVKLEIFGPSHETVGSELLNPPLPSLSPEPNLDATLVAMVDSGVNYLLPQIQSGLARSQSGDFLGYDFWDLDKQPFDAQTPGSPFFVQRHGTRTASILLEEAPAARLVPYRYPRPDMRRMKALIAHADSLGVRIVGMPLGSKKMEDWIAFEQEAIAHPHILFVVSAGNNGLDIDVEPIYPASMDIDNMIVVTSADDFQRPAERTNWGVQSVDYTVPAEAIMALDFNGDLRQVSGSSYAVSRVSALAVNILASDASMSVDELKNAIQSYALAPGKGRYVDGGFIPDTRRPNANVSFRFMESASQDDAAGGEGLDVSVVILDARWQSDNIQAALSEANQILSVCGIHIQSRELFTAETDDYLKDLSAGTAHTVLTTFYQLRPAAEGTPPVTLVFARDSKMQDSFEAEAFGEGNTRSRRWLQNSLWVTYGARDLGLTLAHELFHIFSNDGRHVSENGNLMVAETAGDNAALTEAQCESARAFF